MEALTARVFAASLAQAVADGELVVPGDPFLVILPEEVVTTTESDEEGEFFVGLDDGATFQVTVRRTV